MSLLGIAKNTRGQSLVQVLITVGIMGILLVAMTSAQLMQTKENHALSEKLAANDLARAITATISGPMCSQLFNGTNLAPGANLRFDVTTVSPTTPHLIDLLAIPNGTTSPVAALNQPASPLSSTPMILAAGGIQVAVTGATTANLIVKFNQNQLQRAIHNLTFPIILQTAPPATTITGCVLPASSFRYEGGQNVSGSTCSGVNTGGFCSGSFMKHITFATAFTAPPLILVSARVESIFTYCPCCNGAYDQAIASPLNITNTGFDVQNSISPWGNDCGPPYSDQGTEMAFDWMAFGS